jgi:ABC-2 type transport system ATP-binding protein
MLYLIDKLELQEELERPLRTLSGGKKQATALACSVIGNPELIILDEPTNGLDPEKRFVFWKFLKEINKEKQVTIIIITHNVNEIEEIADRVVIIGNAQVLKEGTPNDLKAEISNQIRIELDFDTDSIWENSALWEEYSCKWSEDKKKIFLFVKEGELISCISQFFESQLISQNIKNMQIYRSSLEDIYIKIRGEKIE